MCDTGDMQENGIHGTETNFVFQRGKPSVRPLGSERSDGAEWMSASPQKRIAAVEFLRSGFAGPSYATQRLSRFLGVARRA
jgi:hypothetical protein